MPGPFATKPRRREGYACNVAAMWETFLVTLAVEVKVEGAAGGWKSEPIMDAVREACAGGTWPGVRRLTIEAVDRGEDPD